MARPVSEYEFTCECGAAHVTPRATHHCRECGRWIGLDWHAEQPPESLNDVTGRRELEELRRRIARALELATRELAEPAGNEAGALVAIATLLEGNEPPQRDCGSMKLAAVA